MGIVNACIGAACALNAAHLGSSVDYMDSTEYAAAVANKARHAIEAAGESILSASKLSGIPRSTLDRKLNSGKGVNALTVRELFDIAKVSGTSAAELARVYETEEVAA